MIKNITDRIDSKTHLDSSELCDAPPFPKSVKIELSAVCNLSCEFCATPNNLRAKGFMDFSLYKSILDKLKSLGVSEIGLFYLGESLLYKQLTDAIKYAASLKFDNIYLTTNGILLDKEKINDIMKAGLNSLKFSLNYNSPDMFNMITKSNPKFFYTIIENIKLAFNIRNLNNYNCGIFASSIMYNDNTKSDFSIFLESIKPFIDEHYWLACYNQANLVETSSKTGGNVGRFDNQTSVLPCWVLFSHTHITHTGDVVACCFSHTQDFIMGNIKTDNLLDIWYSDKYTKLRNAHINNNIENTPCSGCVK